MNHKQDHRYISSLKDGRSVWLNGEKVKDITIHPEFSGTLSTISHLLGTLDSKEQDVIGYISPRTNEFVHKAFFIPRSLDDLISRRKAFDVWSRKTYGVMSRLSDYANSLITGYFIDRDYFDRFDSSFSKKITAYYENARDERRVVTTGILDPQIDRSKPNHELEDKDALLRIVCETDEGVIVRGAKMIATAAPYAHDVIIMPHQKLSADKTEYANLFIVSLNSPGLQIVCRESFSSQNRKKHPLSAQFDEMDAVLIFDDVLVPWERVFIKGSIEGVFEAQQHQQLNSLAHHQTVVRLLAKLEFVAGVATAIAQSIGADHYLHVQEKLGELYTQIESIDALLISAELQGSLNEKSVYLPDRIPLQTARNLGTRYYPRAIEILKQIGAGGFIQLPSTAIEESNSLSPLLHKYYKGAKVDAPTKTALFQIGWDLIGSSLGSRHDLYERLYTGDPIRTFALQYDTYDKEPLKHRLQVFWEILLGKEKANEKNHSISSAAQ
ncbi:4-hydroxyphenylacetate 3-hydroxylase (plasmid) [Cytobacillus oceanisediminis]|uniref:4-hydroxyphenylacetate 3-hydroxylase family protein n=1 Tax=Cytobacillus oceanisediminis TaxID=665099 RepID=UPI001863E2D7|nr:4-hydroxyphenylacetate 3-hydroxylase N-terminal domain-containing protein [Cytobacillus oceanisediminis]QOK29883.1 4-hydroxyphenylacetate 3-hydroxylase [Cytobacillus oceanisediminis]